MVRTRFAPSPTGYLHIGGVRTALFNWLYARKNGGQFILRIDDTDQKRNIAEALAPILHGFRWLGMDWDEGPEVGGPYGPYYQSEKLDRYQQAVEQLLKSGHAYWDYATREELEAEKEAAQRQKRSYVYKGKWRAETESDRRRFEAEGRTGVVRLSMPGSGTCEFRDHIRGDMKVEWATEPDHVIQRDDGTVLYNLANVVDDFDMKISHVIRAEEHLSNTPRQIFITQSLGYPLPEYAHIPFVAEPGSKQKLSKRKLDKYLKNADFAKLNQHGERIAKFLGLETSGETFNPVIVDFYERVGYLPDAIVNYLVLLGWSLDGENEFFSRDVMISAFDFDRVNQSAASFDPAKLSAFQAHYMVNLDVDTKTEMVIPFLQQAGILPEVLTEERSQLVKEVVTQAAHRIEVTGDIFDYSYFFQADELFAYDEKSFEKEIRKEPGPSLLQAAREQLAESDFNVESLKVTLESIAEQAGVKPRRVNSAVRVAVTGVTAGFGMYETLILLGRERCLTRIERALRLV